MRVYVPATVPMLRTLVSSGQLAAVSGTAFALTPAFRESYATGDTEELEYAAMNEAARASLRLLSADSKAVRRRVVVVAEMDEVTPRPDLDAGVVRLTGPVPMRTVAAVHVDNVDAEPAVAVAVEAVDAADLGDEDAEFVLGDAEDHELAWYAPGEVGFLLELM